jgi:hypothetical protein
MLTCVHPRRLRCETALYVRPKLYDRLNRVDRPTPLVPNWRFSDRLTALANVAYKGPRRGGDRVGERS